MQDITDTYVAVGAGGLSVIVVVWVLVFLVKKMYPLLVAMKEDTGAYKEVIKNNTEAVKEVSKSNENVATALQLLNSSINQQSSILTKHDERSQGIENDIIRIKERLGK